MANNAAEVSISYVANDITTMKGQLQEIANKEHELENPIKINIDTDSARSKLNNIVKKIDGIKEKTIKIAIDTSAVNSQIIKVLSGAGAGSKGTGATVKFNTSAAESAMRNLGNTIEEVKAKAKNFTSKGGDTNGLYKMRDELKIIQKLWNNSGKSGADLQAGYSMLKDTLADINSEMNKLKSQTSLNSSVEKQTKSIQSSYLKDIGSAQTALNKLSTSVNSLYSKGASGVKIDGISESIRQAENELSTLKKAINEDPSRAQDPAYVQQFKDVSDSIERARLSLSEFKTEFAKDTYASKKSGYITQLDELYKSIENGGPKFDSLKDRINTLKESINNNTAGSASKIASEIKSIGTAIDEIQSKSFSGFLTNIFGSIGNAAKSFAVKELSMFARKAVQEVFTNVKEIDSSMTQLQIVTGANNNQLATFFNESADAANRLGSSVTEVLDSVQVFSRLGYNLEDSLNLSEYATIMSNVADTSVDEATSGLTAIIKGFDMNASDAERVVDVLVDVGQKYAISASELMKAFENGGAALSATGNSFEESAALFAAANAAIQNSSKVGTALRTVSARITGSKTELEELGEDYEDVADGISKYREEIMALTNINGSGGVDIMENAATGDYKNTYEIFVELSKVWGDLSETTQARVAEILGGTRQLSVISSIIGNISDAENAYTDAMNANGTAQEAQSIYLDSIEGRMNQLHSSWQVLSKDLLDSNVVKFIVSAGNVLVNILDAVVSKVGMIPTAGILLLLKNFKGLSSAAKAMNGAFAISGGNMFSSMSTGVTVLIKSIGTLQAGLLGVAAAAAIAYGAYKVYDAYYDYDEKRDSYTDSKGEYDQTKSELSSLDAKIDETEAKIAKLESAGQLSLVDSAELNKLKVQNEQLNTEYEIKKKIADLQQESTRQAAADALHAKVSTEHKQSEFLSDFGKASGIALDANYDNIIDEANAYIDALDRIEEIISYFNKLASESSSEKDIENYEKSITTLDTLEGEYQGELSGILDEIYSYRSEFIDDNGNIIKGYEDEVEKIDALIQRMLTAEEVAKETQDAIEELLNAGTKDTLISAVSDYDGAEEFATYAEELGVALGDISAEDFYNYISYLALAMSASTDEMEGASEAAISTSDSIKNLSSAYKTLGSAISEMSTGKLSSDTISDIISQLTKADDNGFSYLQETGKNLGEFFDIENGGLVLNTKAYKEYASAQANAYLNSLYDKRDSIDALSYPNMAEYNKAVGEVNNEIAIYKAAIAEATSLSDTFFSSFDTSTSMYSTFDEIYKKIETGGMSMQEALSYAEKYPEISGYITGMVDGYKDMDAVLDSILAKDITNQVAEIDKQLADPDITEREIANLQAIRQGYVDLAEAVMLYGREAAVVNKGVERTSTSTSDRVSKQIKNLWTSDVFSSAREDLEKLAKQSGITSQDILELAENNEYLAYLLNDSGISATFLAEVLERMSESGASALDNITERALELDSILSELAPHMNSANEAFNNYQNSLNNGDYDDTFDNYQQVALDFMQNIEDGNFGKDFYRQMEFLTGSATGDWSKIQEMYKEIPKLYGLTSKDDKWSADENSDGYGVLEQLYKNWDKVKSAAEQAGDSIESTLKLTDDGYEFKWETDDVKYFAEALGVTEDAAYSALNALSMYGAQMANFDYEKLASSLVDNYSVDGIVSEGVLRSQLELLGLESFQVDLITEHLKDMYAAGETPLNIVNEGTVEGAYALGMGLKTLTDDADGIVNLNDVLAELDNTYGITGEAAANFLKIASEQYGFKFIDENGLLVGANNVTSTLTSSTDELISNAKNAQSALNALGYNFDMDFSGTDIGELESSISRIKASLSGMNPDTSEYQNLYSIMLGLEAVQNRIAQNASTANVLAKTDADVQPLVDAANAYVAAVQSGVTDTSNLKAQLDSFSDSDIKLTFGVDGSDELVALLDQFADSNVTPTVDTGALLQQINDTLSGIADGEITITADSSGADSVIQKLWKSILTLIGTPKTIRINANDNASSTLSNIIGLLSSIKSKTVTVTTNHVDVNGSSGVKDATYWGKYYGVNGTAYARGNWRTKKSVTALTGELGQELVIPPNGNEWYTVGDNGAEFAEIPRGSIVFNHEQTEELFKRGRVFGRGKISRNGSALASGTAFALGGTVYKKNNATSSSYTNSSSSSSSYKSSSSSSSAASAADDADILDWIEVLLERIERKISNLDTLANNAFQSFGDRAGYVRDEISGINSELSAQQAAYDEYMKAAESVGLSEEYKKLVRDGAIQIDSISDETTKDLISKYKEFYEKALDAEDAILKLDEDLGNAYKSLFELAEKEFDGIIGLFDSNQKEMEEYINMVEASGHVVSKSFYRNLITNEEDTMASLYDQRDKMQARLDEGVANGAIKEGTEAWYEMKNAIAGVNEKIAESITSVAEWRMEIEKIDWGEFDAVSDAVGDLTGEIDFYQSMAQNHDMFNNDGSVTEYGLTSIGLHTKAYEINSEEAKRYGEEIAAIDKKLAADPSNQEYLDRKRELVKAQRDAAKSAEDEKKAIVDLIKNGIEKQLEALKKLIDQYKDALDSAKDLYDYQKKIDEKSSKVSSLQKQLAAYSGDDSEETRKTMQKLAADLEEAEEDLYDTQYDRYVSDQKELLDHLYDSYELTLNSRLDDVDGLIQSCTDAVNGVSDTIVGLKIGENISSVKGTIMDTINGISDDSGVNLSGYVTSIFTGAGGVIDVLKKINETTRKNYEESTGEAIIDQMKKNGAAWGSATTSQKSALHAQNVSLAEQYEKQTGKKLTYVNGTWFTQDGKTITGEDAQPYIQNILKQMKSNGAAWGSASASKKKELEAANEKLAEGLAGITGLNIYKKNGEWLVNGMNMFDYFAGIQSIKPMTNTIPTKASSGSDSSWSSNVSALASTANVGADYLIQQISSQVGNIQSAIANLGNSVNASQSINVSNTFDSTISLPSVKNYEEFVEAMKKDPKFEKMVQAMTIEQLTNPSSVSKNIYSW